MGDSAINFALVDKLILYLVEWAGAYAIELTVILKRKWIVPERMKLAEGIHIF